MNDGYNKLLNHNFNNINLVGAPLTVKAWRSSVLSKGD